MSKNKTNRRISQIVLAGMLIALLPATSLQGQASLSTETISRNVLKGEVNQKIREIKKVINRLGFAKAAIATTVAVGGLLIIAVILSLLYRIIPFRKYSRELERVKGRIKEGKPFFFFKTGMEKGLQGQRGRRRTGFAQQVYRSVTTAEKLKFEASFAAIKEGLVDPAEMVEWFKWRFFRKRPVGPISDIAWAERFYAHIFKKAPELDWVIRYLKAKKFITPVVVNIILGLISLLILRFTVIKTPAFFGLSGKSVAKAFDNIKDLEQIEKDNPGILTTQQKKVMDKMEGLRKKLLTGGIIKNLRLKGALTVAVNTALQQSNIAMMMKKKGARKLFSSYIKLKWKEKTAQKTIDQYAALEISVPKNFYTKLKKIKKKIANLETEYGALRATLKKGVEMYSTQANKIQEGLKKELMQKIETKALKSQPLSQPVIPLSMNTPQFLELLVGGGKSC